jgi:hypothetical protein
LTSEPGIGECRRYISVASVEVTGDDGTNGPVRRLDPAVDAELCAPPAPLRWSNGTANSGRRPTCITPTTSWSWNLEAMPFSHDREVVVDRTVHEAPVGQN